MAGTDTEVSRSVADMGGNYQDWHRNRHNRVKNKQKWQRQTQKEVTSCQKRIEATESDTEKEGSVSEMRPETEGKGSQP